MPISSIFLNQKISKSKLGNVKILSSWLDRKLLDCDHLHIGLTTPDVHHFNQHSLMSMMFFSGIMYHATKQKWLEEL